MAFKRVKGTQDFYPDDMSVRKKIFNSLRKSAESFNFKEVEAPALESMELLTCKSGEEIKSQIFTLEKRSKEEIGLRFELTASLARMFIRKQKQLSKPVKWYALSRMWRYEQPQAGREREFYQLNAELLGSDKPLADAEVISLAIKCLADLGLSEKDFVVKVNNRKLLQGLLSEFIDKDKMDAVFKEIDKISKLQRGEVEANLRDIGIDEDQIESIFDVLLTESLEEIEPNNKMAKEGLKELDSVMKFLDNKYVEMDLSTVRGLAYYTGTVFEIFDRKGKLRAIAGGGRYDDMVQLFGGEPAPATGFAIGFSTLTLLLEKKGILPAPEPGCDYYIAPVSPDMAEEAVKIASELRKKYKVEIDLMNRKLGKQLSHANSVDAKNAIIIGEDEVKEGKVKIRDLVTGKEKKSKVDDI